MHKEQKQDISPLAEQIERYLSGSFIVSAYFPMSAAQPRTAGADLSFRPNFVTSHVLSRPKVLKYTLQIRRLRSHIVISLSHLHSLKHGLHFWSISLSLVFSS